MFRKIACLLFLSALLTQLSAEDKLPRALGSDELDAALKSGSIVNPGYRFGWLNRHINLFSSARTIVSANSHFTDSKKHYQLASKLEYSFVDQENNSDPVELRMIFDLPVVAIQNYNAEDQIRLRTENFQCWFNQPPQIHATMAGPIWDDKIRAYNAYHSDFYGHANCFNISTAVSATTDFINLYFSGEIEHVIAEPSYDRISLDIYCPDPDSTAAELFKTYGCTEKIVSTSHPTPVIQMGSITASANYATDHHEYHVDEEQIAHNHSYQLLHSSTQEVISPENGEALRVFTRVQSYQPKSLKAPALVVTVNDHTFVIYQDTTPGAAKFEYWYWRTDAYLIAKESLHSSTQHIGLEGLQSLIHAADSELSLLTSELERKGVAARSLLTPDGMRWDIDLEAGLSLALEMSQDETGTMLRFKNLYLPGISFDITDFPKITKIEDNR